MGILVNNLVDIIHRYFNNHLDLEELDSIKLKYTLQVIINELSKSLILLIIFSFINKEIYLIYSLLTLFSIRLFTGGIHFKTYNGCLTFSCLFFLIVLVISTTIKLNIFLENFLFIFTVITILVLAPVSSKSRPEFSITKKRKLKYLGIICVFIHYLLFLFSNENSYPISSIWILAFQALELILSKGVSLYDNKKLRFQKSN